MKNGQAGQVEEEKSSRVLQIVHEGKYLVRVSYFLWRQSGPVQTQGCRRACVYVVHQARTQCLLSVPNPLAPGLTTTNEKEGHDDLSTPFGLSNT